MLWAKSGRLVSTRWVTSWRRLFFFFFQAEDGIRDGHVTGVQTCALPITFYRDETKRDKLLDVLQDRKWQPITATYTVRDRSGRTMALLWKNYLYNVVRKRWYVKAPDGTTRYVAKEDSVILSLLRRLLGPLFGLLRTNS